MIAERETRFTESGLRLSLLYFCINTEEAKG